MASYVERVLSRACGRPVRSGEYALANIDLALSHEASWRAIAQFEELGTPIFDAKKLVFVLDHRVPAESVETARTHKRIREFAKNHGIRNYDINAGICHQVVIEEGLAREGMLVAGTDSHTPTCGAVGAVGVGIGATEMAGVWSTGKLWLKVPKTTRIEIKGRFRNCVGAKDLALMLIGRLGPSYADYKAIEFCGEALEEMSVSSRMTLCNMATELGAKTAYFTREKSDCEDALEFDISALAPQVALPDSVENAVGVEEAEGQPIDQAFLGSCVNGRLEDIEDACRILEGRRVHDGVRLLVSPASWKVYSEALEKGYISTIIASGGLVLNPGCSACLGQHQGMLAEGESCISSSNRNFAGRMGAKDAKIYIASPATVAASAIAGKIADPRHAGSKVQYRRRGKRGGPRKIANRAIAMTSSPNAQGGRTWRLGDNVDTDTIYPGQFLRFTDEKEMAKHAFGLVAPGFSSEVRKGDLIIAGANFGCGSSREQAAICIRACGITTIIARSFSRIFFRNCVNLGIAPVSCERVRELGNVDRLDLREGRIYEGEKTFECEKMPQFIVDIIEGGGLIEYLKNNSEMRIRA